MPSRSWRASRCPTHNARLTEQWGILFHASQYVEEGYATWIERYLAEEIAETHPEGAAYLRNAPQFSVEGLLAALGTSATGADCAAAIEALFAAETPGMESIHAAMLGAIEAIDADAVADLEGAIGEDIDGAEEVGDGVLSG